jgi:hypothetical protein
MKARTMFGSVIVLSLLSLQAYSNGREQLQKYFNDAALKVKATENPVEKRKILDDAFRTISTALDVVAVMPFIPNDDVAGMKLFKAALQEKQYELAGTHGYTRVADVQLNAFSSYVVQDMEQADQVITISLVTLVIIVLVILILV